MQECSELVTMKNMNLPPIGFFLTTTILMILVLGCNTVPPRTEGPGDLFTAAGFPCVTAHSSTRALFASYNGPLYQLTRESDGATMDIGVVEASAGDAGGYANAAAHDEFCANSLCWISIIYDQSGNDNHLMQAPPGTFVGPAKGGFNSLPIADMAPITLNGHKVYGTYVMPGAGLRNNNAVGLAINDEPEGIYMVLNGDHYSSGCCFNYGNTSTNSRAVGTGTMSTVYYGTATAWGKGEGDGPWIMSDMEAGLFSGYETKENAADPSIDWRFVTGMVNGGGGNQWEIWGANAQEGDLINFYKGERPQSKENDRYYPMHRKGSVQMGNGGDNGNGSAGTFYEGVITKGYPTEEVVQAVQANIVAANYAIPNVHLSRLTSFSPGAAQELTVTFTNTSDKAASDVQISINLPQGWPTVEPQTIDDVGSGESVTLDFMISSPTSAAAGYLSVAAEWSGQTFETRQRVRTVPPIKVNELGLSGGSNRTHQFLELYNASDATVDISSFSVVNTKSEWAPLELAKIPEGTTLGAREFYLLGLATSGLMAPTNAGDGVIYLRSTEALSVGQEIDIEGESATIAQVGTAASDLTTIFVPVSTGPWLQFPVGTTNLPVTNAEGFKIGDKIGIDIGGNYEVATVTEVGKASTQSSLAEEAKVGDTMIKVWQNANMTTGDTLTINTGARVEYAVVKNVISVVQAPLRGRFNGDPGEVELVSPLQKDHMLAVDVASPGTGITFSPATRFAHKSGDAVQALGSGVTLQDALSKNHDTGAPVVLPGNTTVGYQGAVQADQWYGLPMSTFAGSVSLIDATGEVVIDAIVYGSQQGNSSARGTIASPEVATLEGDQSQGGCIVAVPGTTHGSFNVIYDPTIRSLGRFPDGSDSDSNCEDFKSQHIIPLAVPVQAGSQNIKVTSVENFSVGERIVIGVGSSSETLEIAEIGTPGGTLLSSRTKAGATTFTVASVRGFSEDQTITIGEELAVIDSITPGRRSFFNPALNRDASITLSKPLRFSHSSGEEVSGSGITLSMTLRKSHSQGEQISSSTPTPGAANDY